MLRKLLLSFSLAMTVLRAGAAYVPVVVNGYNADVVANGTGNASASTNNDVDGVNYAFMAADFNPSGTLPTQFLPTGGLVNSVNTPGLMFQMASYSANNSLRIAGAATDSILFATPQSAGELYLMATSGSGATTVSITVNFTDGTSQAFTGLTVNDWYGGANFAIQGLGRVTIATNTIDNNVNDPRLYETQLVLNSANYTKLVRSISFNKTSTAGVLNVMGVTLNTVCSGTPTPGTANANVSVTCPNAPFNLSLTGNSTGVSMSYQWQSSATATGTYTNVGTASPNPTFTTSATATMYYRAAVTCGTATSYSAPVQVTISSLFPGGTYTINSGAPGTTTNFQSFTAAVAAISCGIAGPVVFNVVAGAPAYNEQISIPSIGGSSGVNTITFNGNGNTLTFGATLSTAPHTLVLNGADYITFNDLNIVGTGTYALVCHLWNQADSNRFTNCTFTAPPNGTGTAQVPFSISGSATSGTSSGTGGNYNIITGCTISSGYYNTCIIGSSTNNALNNQVINCTLKDFYFYGSYNSYAKGTVLSGCTIERPTRTTLSTFYGAYLTTGTIAMTLDKNKFRDPFVNATTSTSTAYGIYQIVSATAGNENMISNNLFYNFKSNGTQYPIYLSSYNYTSVLHNTVVLDDAASTAGTTYGIYSTGTIGVVIRNNIVYVSRGGSGTKYCLYYSGAKTSDYNDLFISSTTGTNALGYFGSAQTTMAAWRTASGMDANSVNIDPVFTAPATGDFKPTAVTLNDLGTPTVITTDILNITRNPTTPDIGAYEFGSAPCPAVTGLTASPVGTTTATLTWTAVTGATGYEYVLDQLSTNPPGAGTATTAVTYNATPLLPFTTYYMHVRTNCGSGNFSPWVTISFVTQCVAPAASITAAGATTVCSPASVVLNANTGTGISYQWKRGGTDITGATSASYTAATSGSYTVVTNIGTCATTSTPVVVTVLSRPDTAVTVSPVTATVCAGSNVTLTAPTGTGLTYQWLLNNAPIAGATGNVYNAGAAGAYRVRVSNGTCADTSSIRTVTVLPAPVATVTLGGATTICAGSSVLLTGPAPTTGIIYQWQRNGTNIAGATARTYAATAAGNYRLVLSNGTCADTSTASTISINPLPTATLTAGGPTSFCIGGNVLLSANTATGVTYKWLRTSVLIPGATAATYTATATGTYAVIVTNTATGCSDTSRPAIPVLASAIPSATLTVTGALTFCQGSSVRFDAATGTGYTYTWYKDAAVIPGANTSSYTATAAGVYYAVISNGGCVTTTTTRTVIVNPLPASAITASGPTNFCDGDNVVLSANTGAGLNYTWRRNGIATGNTSATLTATTGGTYDVIVSNGTCPATSNTIIVIVSTPPAPVISTSGPTTLCQGGNLVLSTTANAAYTYQWQLNGVSIPGANSATYAAVSGGTYTVVVTNGPCVVTSAALPVTVNALPPALVLPQGATTFCQGAAVSLHASIATGFSYQWQLNGTAISGANASVYLATASGDYSVVISDPNCSATSTDVRVTVNPMPAQPAIVVSNGNVLTTGSYVSYQWFLNGIAIPGATNRSYTAVANGSYTVMAGNFAGCQATSEVLSISTVGVGGVAKNLVHVYPNPTSDKIYIDADKAVNISIRSIDGKEVIRKEDAKEVDLHQLADGVYLVRITDKNGQLVKIERLVKAGK